MPAPRERFAFHTANACGDPLRETPWHGGKGRDDSEPTRVSPSGLQFASLTEQSPESLFQNSLGGTFEQTLLEICTR